MPLLWADRIYDNPNEFSGYISLYDHGETPITNPLYKLKVTDEPRNAVIFEGNIPCTGDKTPFSVSLAKVRENSMLKVSITVDGSTQSYTNSWTIFVYRNAFSKAPADCTTTSYSATDHTIDNQSDNYDLQVLTENRITDDISAAISKKFIRSRSDYDNAVNAGGRYLILQEFYGTENTVKNSYIPVFWSPVHFPSEAPVGFMIDEASEVLKHFPTGHYADYQWKTPVDNSVSLRLKDAPLDAHTVLEFVPNFSDNEPKSPLFTFRDGNAEFLFCGFDLTLNDPASAALKCSILSYIDSYPQSDSKKTKQIIAFENMKC